MIKDFPNFKSNLEILLLTILFIIFVTPYSFRIGQEGVSGNYLFILFPIFYYIVNFWNRSEVHAREIIRPSKSVLFFMLTLFVIFFTALYDHHENLHFSFRRIASFIAFMSIFTLMFVKIDNNMLWAFKYAIVIFTLYSSIDTLIQYINFGGAELGTYAKGKVGTNRIGFVYVIALWITYFFNSKTLLISILKHLVVSIIIIGLLLTFSRSSMIALFSSIIVYFFVTILIYLREKKSYGKLLKKLLLSIAYIVGMSIVLGNLFPNTVSESNRMIFDYISPVQKSLSVKAEASIDELNELTTNSTSKSIEDKTTKKLNELTTNSTSKSIEDKTTKKLNELTTNSSSKNIEDNNFIESIFDLSNANLPKALIDLSNKTSSIGYRYYVMKKVIDFVGQNPFNGSGFLGVWIVLEKVDGQYKGSAHGQFVDVLFRLGLIGFFIYLFFTYKILLYLFKQDIGLFIGFFGILVYGLFHETFKLSQGAFIFAFLFAMYDQKKILLGQVKSHFKK